MIFNQTEAEARLLKYHPENGKVHTKFKEVMREKYTDGTNLVLKFMYKFRGLRYGAQNMNMEYKVDCAEFPRICYYIFFGKDIGSYSDGQYKSSLGVKVGNSYGDLPDMRPLDCVYYDTTSRKITGHVAVVYDKDHLIQSGASILKSRVGLTALYWGKGKYPIVTIKRFITDEEYASVIVGGDIGKNYTGGDDVIKKGDKGAVVAKLQTQLMRLGYALPKYGADGDFGNETESAVIYFQQKHGLPQTGKADAMTLMEIGDDMGTIVKMELAKQDGNLQHEISVLQSKINAAINTLK